MITDAWVKIKMQVYIGNMYTIVYFIRLIVYFLHTDYV